MMTLRMMMHPDAYPILSGPSRAELKVKGSIFLALAFPLRAEDEAARLRNSLIAEYRSARHQCWALRLGRPGEALERHSDAGEPAGSAGPPIARAIRSSSLSDLLIVVIRWFGGTKLGVGGLIRAYGESAARALENAPTGERLDCLRLSGRLPFELEGNLRALLQRRRGRVLKLSYGGEGLEVEVELPRSDAAYLEKSVRDWSRGRFSLCEVDDSSEAD